MPLKWYQISILSWFLQQFTSSPGIFLEICSRGSGKNKSKHQYSQVKHPEDYNIPALFSLVCQITIDPTMSVCTWRPLHEHLSSIITPYTCVCPHVWKHALYADAVLPHRDHHLHSQVSRWCGRVRCACVCSGWKWLGLWKCDRHQLCSSLKRIQLQFGAETVFLQRGEQFGTKCSLLLCVLVWTSS